MKPIGIIGFVFCLALFFFFGYRYGINSVDIPEYEEKRDTVTISVPEYIDRPVPKYITKYKTDTAWFPVIKVIKDSSFVEVPIERRVYEEDSLYRCEISGYRPQLEYLEIYPTTTTITIHDTKTEYRNSQISFGLQAGYGVSKSGLSPYIGAGISYNLFSINNLKNK